MRALGFWLFVFAVGFVFWLGFIELVRLIVELVT